MSGVRRAQSMFVVALRCCVVVHGASVDCGPEVRLAQTTIKAPHTYHGAAIWVRRQRGKTQIE